MSSAVCRRTVMLVPSTPTRSQISAHSNAGGASVISGMRAVWVRLRSNFTDEDKVATTSGSRANTASGAESRCGAVGIVIVEQSDRVGARRR